MKVRFSDIDLFLEPGGLHVSAEPAMVKTILGSCVAVCLHDRKAGVGGLNHYVLPQSPKNHPPDARYGTFSIQMLIERIQRCGATLRRLQAIVVGGARPVGNGRGPQVGAANRDLAVQMLAAYAIPIVKEHTGGEQGRRLFFNTETGQAVVSLIQRSAAFSVTPERRAGA